MAQKRKVGRPKLMRPHDLKLVLPKHPVKYKAKRLYWALIEMEKRMSKDITSVKMSEYKTLLESYVEVTQELAKEGIKYGSATKKRMEQQGMVQDEHENDEATDSGVGSVGVGVGVPPVNPLA